MEFFQRIIAAIVAFFMSIAAFLGIPVKKPIPVKNIQNVIYMIGDGMGENHLEKTKSERGVSLIMDTLPQKGYITTYSQTDETTDSAAAGTALACGIKTYNGAIGWYWFDAPESTYVEGDYPLNITTLCASNGMKTGVITTDNTTGATPAAFTAHAPSRGNDMDIYAQQLASGFDLIWGKADSFTTAEEITAAGYTYIDTIESMNALTPGTKSFGQFNASLYHTYNSDEVTPTLSQMTEKAISLLDGAASAEGEDPNNGFFLMIEGAHIDKKSHDNNSEKMTDALMEFDNAVAKAIEFAEADGHTLVVVTADHETGGLTLDAEGNDVFTTSDHTSANVPLRVYGPVEFVANGEILDNTDVPKKIALALEFKPEAFPLKVNDTQTTEPQG